MDLDTDSSRGRAARLRTVCLRAGAVLATLIAVVAVPAAASAAGRRHHQARHKVRRHARHHRRPRRTHPRATRHHTVRHHAHTHSRSGSVHAPACPGSHTRLGRDTLTGTHTSVVCLLNLHRAGAGLPRLRDSPRLNRSAQSWTNTMVRERAFSHGADFASRISASGFHWSQIGENIAGGFRTPAGVVAAWMRSTGHCENILNPTFREVGVGADLASVQTGSRRGTWTLDFGLRMGQRPASGNWAPAEGCPY